MRALREEREWTQQQLGDRVDISQKYVSELERGRKSPSWDLLISIAHEGFEIRLATLMFGIDEDIGTEPRHVNELLAGRSKEARYDVLRAVQLLLKAGEGSK
ncbi:MAG: helix-turn-helix transcriptional regulator [Deltaproteobacteria bacterium]|nr:helix-turn-helix transcriptional regulator [Nannocystaceae bacterium]